MVLVKMARSRSPKKWLEETMVEFPDGVWITMMEGKTKAGIDLLSIGYDYNTKKVLTFIVSEGVGSTKEGAPLTRRGTRTSTEMRLRGSSSAQK